MVLEVFLGFRFLGFFLFVWIGLAWVGFYLNLWEGKGYSVFVFFLSNVLFFLSLQLFLFLLGFCCFVRVIYFAAIHLHFLAQNLSSANSDSCFEEIY